ncbi:ankyrin repeat domain-containing protein 50-like [Haliotis rubra]|uniref:ankyrin repeat domain-containing protein 50-like n=1 Tax=Haliotis rubra TaxID=36100 RepID=UPI001EE504B7|nr:ankyrin repeat domain-containing protein 50-like [Haliotis rubra]
MLAAGGGHTKVMELLVGKGAKLSLVDSFGFNIIHSACHGGDLEMVKYVLSQTMLDINGGVQCGRTAMMLAAENGHKDVVELLVDTGADVSLVDETGDNILHCACRGGDVEVVQYILSQNMVDINSLGHEKKTPVMLAGQYGHKEVVEVLVKHGANLSLRDKVGDNILHLACFKGHVDVVKYIISLHRVYIDSRGFERKTPVMKAGEGGHKEVVEFLVNHGADLALRDSDTNIILHLISYWGGSVDVGKYVLSQHKVNINQRGWRNRPPVLVAGENGYKDLVELFVKHGAKLSLKDRRKMNILHCASDKGHLAVVMYIVSLHSVDIDSEGFENKTPMMFAGQSGHKDVVEFLVNHGADLAHRDSDTNIILHLISYWGGSVDVGKYVLSQHKVNINQRGWRNRPPVLVAGENGYKDLVELFVKHGAKLSLKDSHKMNILHCASDKGHLAVVMYIVSLHSVDIDSEGLENKTPMMFAGQNGHKDVVEFLVNHGAQLSLADREGNNILLLAVSHVEVVKYILSLGVVNIDAKNRKGESAAMRAKARRQRDVLDVLVSHGGHT